MNENASIRPQSMDDLKSEVQKSEFNKVRSKNLCPSQQDAFQERLYKIIDYAIDRHDWYDEQRSQFLQIGLALMAVGASIGAILVNFGKTWTISIYTLTFVIALISAIFLSGLSQLYLYNKGIQRDYPYRKIADIRSWYFKYNFPSGLEDNLSKDPNKAYDQVKEVKDNLERFYDRILEYANDKNSMIKEDLEQIFILLLLQRYRQQQVKSMSNTLFYSMLIVSILLIFTLVTFVFLELPSANTSGKNSQDMQGNETFIPISINVFIENESSYLQNRSSKSMESQKPSLKGDIKSIRVLS